ncbi:hypothetical protein [Algoriphagus aquimarinus]|uniref:HNH endonuclease n=1 Tax=Algoriphagus aquimarinus TaxID=237018 RepID=A0A1I1CD52_9BACT|nr:hypothetical protein [Algoriphagus aquimarinus]SFB60337.1 hypothetical protein SAMN04489723_1295 [Algoriphagus aquimarinus]
MADESFKLLRKNFRNNGKFIIDHVKRNHFDPSDFAEEDDICSFCGQTVNMTKEHVLPKWCFENDPERSFNTVINDSSQYLIKTVIPACSICNNETLSRIEKYINKLFRNTDLKSNYYEYEESLNVIRWLEIIDYKFHVLNFRRKFTRNHTQDFIPYLKKIPISVMRMNIDMSPYRAMSQLRASQARIRKKDKETKYNSLIFWKSKNKQSLFFHTMDEYIYFEFPEFKMAMFYFYKKEFESNFDAEKEAKQIVIKNYG